MLLYTFKNLTKIWTEGQVILQIKGMWLDRIPDLEILFGALQIRVKFENHLK